MPCLRKANQIEEKIPYHSHPIIPAMTPARVVLDQNKTSTIGMRKQPRQTAGGKHDNALQVLRMIQNSQGGSLPNCRGNTVGQPLDFPFAGVWIDVSLIDVLNERGRNHQQKTANAGHYLSRRSSHNPLRKPRRSGGVHQGPRCFQHNPARFNFHARHDDSSVAEHNGERRIASGVIDGNHHDGVPERLRVFEVLFTHHVARLFPPANAQNTKN